MLIRLFFALSIPLLTLAQQPPATPITPTTTTTAAAARTNFITRTLIQVYAVAPTAPVFNTSNVTTTSYYTSVGTIVPYASCANSSVGLYPSSSGVAGVGTGSPIVPTKGIAYTDTGGAATVRVSGAGVLGVAVIAAVVALL